MFKPFFRIGICLLFPFLCSPLAGAAEEALIIKGSDTLGARLMPQLREAYQQSYPDARFEISAEGSSTGVPAVVEGRADIAMLSRNLSRGEIERAQRIGVDLKTLIVAYDAIAVVVHPKNPVHDLTSLQVEKLFTGDYQDWIAVGGHPDSVTPYIRNAASGTHRSFRELAMRRRDYARHALLLAGNERISDEVSANPKGIGYLGLAFVLRSGARVLTINGVSPSVESVTSGDYPYARPLYFVYDATRSRPVLDQFLQWVISPAGQAQVRAVGFVPLSSEVTTP